MGWGEDSAPQDSQLKRPGPCQIPEVVEVLHMAVANVEHNHGVELFSNHRFRRIHAQHGWFHVLQNYWILGVSRGRVHHITKADIDL